MREQELKKLIIEWLNYQKGLYWVNNSGATISEYKGKKRLIRFGMKGSSDIIGIHPDIGFVAIEVKIKPNKPTKSQEDFIDMINYWGGFAMVAYDLEAVELEFLKRKLIT